MELSKTEKNRISVAKYREKLGKEKVREMTKEYTAKSRSNEEYKKKENEKNKIRNKEKRQTIKIENLNTKLTSLNIANDMVDNIIGNIINDIHIKRGRGRPRMTEEQKAEAKAKRLEQKKSKK